MPARPVVLQDGVMSHAFIEMAKRVAQQVSIYNARKGITEKNVVNN
jgi:hypothetical protein